jgi:hypothetical protein
MNEESKIFGISVRALIAVIVTITICGMSIFHVEIVEPMYSIGIFVIGFFFGQKTPSIIGRTLEGNASNDNKTGQ